MKRFLYLILTVFLMMQGYAQESKPEDPSTEIELEYDWKNDKPVPHRIPARFGIEAHYDAASQSVVVYSPGEQEGEVFLNGAVLNTMKDGSRRTLAALDQNILMKNTVAEQMDTIPIVLIISTVMFSLNIM